MATSWVRGFGSQPGLTGLHPLPWLRENRLVWNCALSTLLQTDCTVRQFMKPWIESFRPMVTLDFWMISVFFFTINRTRAYYLISISIIIKWMERTLKLCWKACEPSKVKPNYLIVSQMKRHVPWIEHVVRKLLLFVYHKSKSHSYFFCVFCGLSELIFFYWQDQLYCFLCVI